MSDLDYYKLLDEWTALAWSTTALNPAEWDRMDELDDLLEAYETKELS